MPGEVLIRWTIRLSLLMYAVVMLLRLRSRGGDFPKVARWIWLAGAILLIVHEIFAFQYSHHWSQAEAYQATAKGTYEVIGIDWGGGLYVNYLFTLCWMADAIWWASSHASHRQRSRWLVWLLDGFLAFIIVNATVVFHSGFIRATGLTTLGLLVFTAYFTGTRDPVQPD